MDSKFVLPLFLISWSACALASETDANASCRPFLFEVAMQIPIEQRMVKFVEEYQFACTAENVGYYKFLWEPFDGGEPYGLQISTLDYPGQKNSLDSAIESRATSELSRSDVLFYSKTIIPILKAAAIANSPDEKEKLLTHARELWVNYLLPAAT